MPSNTPNKPKRPKKSTRKTPGKSPRIKKMVVGGIVLQSDPVVVPKPYIPNRQRGALLGGAPPLSNGKRKKKKKRTNRTKKTQNGPQTYQRQQRQLDRFIEQQQQAPQALQDTQIINNNSYTASKQVTSMTVVPSTPTVLFNRPQINPTSISPSKSTTTTMTTMTTVTPTDPTDPSTAKNDPGTKLTQSVTSPFLSPSSSLNNTTHATTTISTLSNSTKNIQVDERDESDEMLYHDDEKEEIGIPFGSPRLFHDYRNKKKARETTLTMNYERDANLHEANTLGKNVGRIEKQLSKSSGRSHSVFCTCLFHLSFRLLDSTVFFHSSGLQAKAMTNFSEEASLRSARRIKYLERLEEKMIKAVEKDYSTMKKRVGILQDQRDVRR